MGSGAHTGDEEFDTYFRTVYWSIVRALGTAYGDVEAAEEATRNAFRRAYVRWPRVRRNDSPVAWIRRAAIRYLDDDADRPCVTEPGAIEPGSRRSVSSEVERALASLSVPARTALVLTYLEELPQVEVARSMGISEAAVRAHLDRGLRSVAAAMGSGEGTDR